MKTIIYEVFQFRGLNPHYMILVYHPNFGKFIATRRETLGINTYEFPEAIPSINRPELEQELEILIREFLNQKR